MVDKTRLVELLLKELNIVTYQLRGDEPGTMLYLSDEIEALTGYPVSDFMSDSKRTLDQLVHPEDRFERKQIIMACLNNNSPFELEYRMNDVNGKVVLVLEIGKGQYDQDGTLLSVSGVLIKTTEKVGLEKKAKFLEQTLDQAPAAIVITEPDGSICYVNQAFSDITKYAKDELMGKNPRILKLNTEADIDYQKLWATLLSGKSWHGVFQNKKKNGEEYWERSSIAPLYDDAGNLFKYIGIKQDITVVHADKVEMERLYLMDSLTNVYNRRSFFELAEQALVGYQTDPGDSAVLMLDIDHFKHINDAHGHTCGDEALKKFGAVCSKTIRKTDLIGRIGGEEFVIYLIDTKMDEALGMAERLRHNIEKIVLDCETGEKVSFTVSIGITKPLPSDESFEAVLKRADKAMYQAKRNGRNRVETLL